LCVHNYVPDPLEVPGNVTQDPYPERLAFIRRVSALHAATVCGVALIASAFPIEIDWRPALAYFLALLVILCLVRIAYRGGRNEVTTSVGLLPLLLATAGLTAGALLHVGFPVWSAGLGLAFAVIYAMLCGRDFSFVGQFVLSLIASSTLVALLSIQLSLSTRQAAQALLWNGSFLLYYVYDLASLLARRRRAEELAAVTDLYRDVLNIFGWIVRVVAHWRRHRIWNIQGFWN